VAKAWPVPGLSEADSFRTAAGRVLHTRAAEVMAQRDAVLAGAGGRRRKTVDEDSVEAVHDLRVAIRRLRANFDAFRDVFDPAGYEDRRVRLRDLARILGEVRDADVMTGMLDRRRQSAAERAELAAALDVLRDEALGEASRDRGGRLRAAAGGALAGAISDLVDFVAKQTLVTPDEVGLDAPADAPVPPPPAEPRRRGRRVDPDGPVGPALWALLRRRLRGVRRADEAVPGDPTDPGHGDALHQLRIAVKRLRYVGEVAALVLPGERAEPAGELLDKLADLQDELGEVHDADVLTELAVSHRQSGEEAGAPAGGPSGAPAAGPSGAPAAGPSGWLALADDVAAERERHRVKAESMLAELRPDRWRAVRRPFRALRG
jgi:CHAD domain-containing protein